MGGWRREDSARPRRAIFFADVADAHRRIESGQSVGKLSYRMMVDVVQSAVASVRSQPPRGQTSKHRDRSHQSGRSPFPTALGLV